MASRIRNLTGCTLLAVYGALALLGHAGMHALEGAHVHAPPVADAHPHTHATGCCHHHPHTTASNDRHGCPGEQDEHHHHHGQGHDHDNCLICHHFAAKAALIAVAAPLDLAAGLEHVASVPYERTPGAQRYVLPIRGPPAGVC